jgi:alkylhydroperoxidase/carboxymuconolactone decarboxylase family protein YurZ
MDTRKERVEYRKRATGLILKGPGRIYKAQRAAGQELFADGALSKKTKELMALAVAVATNCFE